LGGQPKISVGYESAGRETKINGTSGRPVARAFDRYEIVTALS